MSDDPTLEFIKSVSGQLTHLQASIEKVSDTTNNIKERLAIMEARPIFTHFHCQANQEACRKAMLEELHKLKLPGWVKVMNTIFTSGWDKTKGAIGILFILSLLGALIYGFYFITDFKKQIDQIPVTTRGIERGHK